MSEPNPIEENSGEVSGEYESYGYERRTVASTVPREPATLTVREQIKQVQAELASRTFFKRYFGPHPIAHYPPLAVQLLIRQFVWNIGPILQGAVILYVFMYAYRNNPVINMEMEAGKMFIVTNFPFHVLNTYFSNYKLAWLHNNSSSVRWALFVIQLIPIFLYVFYITVLLLNLAKNAFYDVDVTADIAIALSLGLLERVLTCALTIYARFWLNKKMFSNAYQGGLFFDLSPYELPGQHRNEVPISDHTSTEETRNQASQNTPQMPETMPPTIEDTQVAVSIFAYKERRRIEMPLVAPPLE